MAAFDNLVQEIDERYRLGPNARPLIEEIRRVISKQPGGVRAYLEKCKAAGFSVEVASWLKGSDPVPLSGEEAEQTLGAGTVSRIAAKVGASQCFARTVLGYAIPKVVGRLARRGAIPAAIRTSALRLLRTAVWHESASRKEISMRGKKPYAGPEPVLGGLIIPSVTLLMILGSLLGYFIGAGDHDVTQPPQAAAQSKSAAPQPAAAMPGWLPPGSSAAAQAAQVLEPTFPVIYFAANRASAVPASRPLLPKVAQLIKQLPKGTVVEIAGYSDSAGQPITNMQLSERRANVIRGMLIRAGVDPGALVAKGHGVFHRPAQASENATIEGRSSSFACNGSPTGRRVEFSTSRSRPSSASLPQ